MFFILGHKGFIHPLLIITEYCSAKHTICRMKAKYIYHMLVDIQTCLPLKRQENLSMFLSNMKCNT